MLEAEVQLLKTKLKGVDPNRITVKGVWVPKKVRGKEGFIKEFW